MSERWQYCSNRFVSRRDFSIRQRSAVSWLVYKHKHRRETSKFLRRLARQREMREQWQKTAEQAKTMSCQLLGAALQLTLETGKVMSDSQLCHSITFDLCLTSVQATGSKQLHVTTHVLYSKNTATTRTIMKAQAYEHSRLPLQSDTVHKIMLLSLRFCSDRNNVFFKAITWNKS